MEPQVVEIQEEQRNVGFPSQQATSSGKGGGNGKWIIAILGVIIIVVVGLVFILMGPGKGDSSASPSPTSQADTLKTAPTENPAPTASAAPTPTAEPKAKDKVAIEVLNGTGKAGEAGFLKGELEDLKYGDISAGNADSQDQKETTAIFSTDLNQAYVDEIVDLLKKLYEDVRVRKQSLSDVDVRITIGPRKQSATSTSTPSASASPTATPE